MNLKKREWAPYRRVASKLRKILGEGPVMDGTLSSIDLNAGIFSAVLQGEFDLDRVGGGIFTAVESYVGIFKGGVAQAVAEREERAVAAVEVVGGAAVGGLAGFERKVHQEGLGAGVRTAGIEVAQLYVRDLVGSIARPVKELKGFQRVALNVGESKVVDFSLPVSALAFWNINNEYIVEPGDFQLWVATDSASGEPVGFTVR